MKTAKAALEALLKKNKYVLLVLALGLVLLLLPSGSGSAASASAAAVSQTGDALTLLLSEMEGVGQVTSLVSDYGAVIVCDGAYSSETRLNVINAVSTYTGLGSNRIIVIQRK